MYAAFRDFWHQFGDAAALYQFIYLVLFMALLNLLIRPKSLRLVVSLLSALWVSLQLLSLYFTRTFIGYQFYTHFNVRGTEDLWPLYSDKIIWAIVLVPSLTFFFYSTRSIYSKLVRRFRTTSQKDFSGMRRWNWFVVVVGLCILGILMNRPKGSIYAARQLFSMYDTDTSGFEEALQKVGMESYTQPQDLRAEPGKNIIILSLESLERGYLSDTINPLTPGLLHLKENWTYLDLEQNYGSNWTCASLYTLLTGFPAYFGLSGNTIFQEVYHSSISSIGHTLNTAGYELSFLIRNSNFAGTKEMVYALGIEQLLDQYNLGGGRPGVQYPFLARDYDLFHRAEQLALTAHREQRSFGIIVSTVDTHHPDGIFDTIAQELVPSPGSDQLGHMVAAVDRMVSDFIHTLDSAGVLENTVVYIFPDHLKLGDPSRFEGTGPRGLYLLTNARIEPPLPNRPLYQIDLPALILRGAEVQHNQKFLSEIVPSEVPGFIEANKHALQRVNTSGLLRTN